MEIVIQEAKLKDIYLIHQVIREAFQGFGEYYPDGIVPALRETPQDILEDLRTKRILTAWCGEMLIGSIRYAYDATGVAYISRFAINPHFQNGGIGKRLLQAVIDEVEGQHGRELALHANYHIKPVLHFYLKNKFLVKDVTFDRGYPRVYLVKDLLKGRELYETMERQVCLQNR